jgi:hypothetical protein
MFLTNQIQLAPSLRQSLKDLEEHSFREYCQKMGFSPKEHERLLLRIAKEEIETILRMSGVDNPATISQIREEIKELLSATDWWEFKRLQIKSQAESVAGAIAKRAPSLPIDWVYLKSVSNELGIPSPTPRNTKSIISFVLAVPHLQVYGTEFNAFVSKETTLDLPCVSVYEHLIVAIEHFLDVVMNAIIQITREGKASVAEPTVLRERGRNSSFVKACSECLDMILCRRDVVVHDNNLCISRSLPEMQLPFRLMAGGATDFVWNHEYGHLLMGHLLLGASHKVEFEADMFAWKTLSSRYDDHDSAPFWYLLGGLSLLTVLTIVELILKDDPSPTHPSAQSRLNVILSHIGKPESSHFLMYLLAILMVCEETVAQAFGVRYGSSS